MEYTLKTKTQKANADIPHKLTRRSSLGDEVYDTLLTQLISLKILPGEGISVDALSHELGVSQTPIRAALIRLEAEGLVAKKHNFGYSAAPMPTREKFNEIYEIRLLLEPHATAKAAKNMTDVLWNRLQEIAENMVKLAEGEGGPSPPMASSRSKMLCFIPSLLSIARMPFLPVP
nr:GntR family transcriptional regulator [Halomonas socia]